MTLAIQAAVDDLTAQTTDLISICTDLKNDVVVDITAAVLVSENATQIPLVTMATSIVSTQASFVNFINGAQA